MLSTSTLRALYVLFVFVFLALLVLLGLTGCSSVQANEPEPLICSDYDSYKRTSTLMMDDAAAQYRLYMANVITYDQANQKGRELYWTTRENLICDDLPESEIVLEIVQASWRAIEAQELSGAAAANAYIEIAYNDMYTLTTEYDWEVLR